VLRRFVEANSIQLRVHRQAARDVAFTDASHDTVIARRRMGNRVERSEIVDEGEASARISDVMAADVLRS
jgi:hypothetical protein